MDITALAASPISESQPAGADAKYEPEYEALAAEIAKLSSVSQSAPISWQDVADNGAAILSRKSKDISVAAYTAVALAHIGGAQLRQLLIAYRSEPTDSSPIAYRTSTDTKTVTGTATQTETETLTRTNSRKSSPPMAALPAGAPSALAGNDDDNIPDHLRTNLLMRRG